MTMNESVALVTGGSRGIGRAIALKLAAQDMYVIVNYASSAEKAQAVLKAKGFTLGRTSVVAVEVPDTPGGLDSVLQLVSTHGINVEYMYAFVHRAAESAVMIFRFDNVEQAITVLQANNFTILPAAQLCAQ